MMTRINSRQISRFRNVLIGCLIVFLLALSTFMCGGAYLLGPSIRARYLFSEVATLQLGRSSFEDAERLARIIHAEPYGACDRSKCEWDATVDNARLPRWWRGSGETFRVSFSVKDSIVVRKNTGFGTGTDETFHSSAVSLEEQEHWGRGNTREPVQAGWSSTDLFRYFRFKVRMTPKASVEDRRRYTAFNYSCFWKYKGCKDARELLPTADRFPTELEGAAYRRRLTQRIYAEGPHVRCSPLISPLNASGDAGLGSYSGMRVKLRVETSAPARARKVFDG